MVDPARVRSKLAMLERYVSRLRELADLGDRLVHRALVRRLADLDAFARAYAGRVAEG